MTLLCPSSALTRRHAAPAHGRRQAARLVALSLALCGVLVAGPAAAQAQTTAGVATPPAPSPQAAQRLVMQVSDADPAKWNLALNNARNVQAELGRDKVAIEIVAYGPGIGMLKMDSVVGPRVAEAIGSGVRILACENTMTNQKMTQADMLPGVAYVPSGVVQLMQRQQQGFAYIRP